MIYKNKNQKKHQLAEAILPIRNSLIFLFTGLVLLLFSNQSHSNDFEQEIKTYLENDIAHYLKSINKTSKQQQIVMYVPPAAKQLSCKNTHIQRTKLTSAPVGRVRLQLSCDNPVWQFRATAKVDLWLHLVVAKRDLQRAEVLNIDMLGYDIVNIAKHVYGMETELSELIGMTVKRNIKQGDLITRRNLENDYLVNKEQHIKLLINSASFSASVKAIALEDGLKGQLIKVKNLSSGKVVEGKTIAKGVVEASLL